MIPEDYKESKGCWNCSRCFKYAEYPTEQDDEYFCVEDCTEMPFTDDERDSVFNLPDDRDKPLDERNNLWHKLNADNWDWREAHKVSAFGICKHWDEACVYHEWVSIDENGIGCLKCGEERYWNEN